MASNSGGRLGTYEHCGCVSDSFICNLIEKPAPIFMISSIKHIIYIVAHVAGDYDKYVVHRQLIGAYGSNLIENDHITGQTLPQIRRTMKQNNYIFQERVMGEDPLIVEKWIS